jgi:hypothetical protein
MLSVGLAVLTAGVLGLGLLSRIRSEANVVATPVAADKEDEKRWIPPVPDKVERCAAQLRPTSADTRWMTIPWLTSLSEGLRVAGAEQRPLLLWNLDGDALEGC